MKQKIIILGTAHGKNVVGKRIPDKKLEEYLYSREIVGLVRRTLEEKGYKVFVYMQDSEVPLPQSVELKARCRFVNELCSRYGTNNCIINLMVRIGV